MKEPIIPVTTQVPEAPPVVAPLTDPDPLPAWTLRRPLIALWYAASRAGDRGWFKPFRRLTHITHHVYLGGQIGESGWQILRSWGIQAIVNMRVEWDDRRLGIDVPYYLWLPTIDGTAPTVEQLARGAEFIHEQTQADRGVYVHCAAGLGRSPTQVMAYLITRGLSPEAAIEFVCQRRPFISLSAGQKTRLQDFADYLGKHPIDYHSDERRDPVEDVSGATVDIPGDVTEVES